MFVVFFLLWVVFNGKLNLEIAIFGAALSAVVYLFSCKFLGYSFEKDKKLFRLIPAAVKYLWLLICEIVKSNKALIGFVYSRKIEVKPQLVTFTTPLKGPFKSILADCITVTPGTISVLSEGDKLTVHALDRSLADGIEDTDFQKQLLEMQKKEELA
ncbi:MAG: Na+/H+ antiporter subunit E [Clostridia bacterium]|nr:Na+/H+ antiporter subunit E [Clostridia bacterium]